MGIALIFDLGAGLLPRPRRRSTCSPTTSAGSRSSRATRPTTRRDDLFGQGGGADPAVVRARGRVRRGLRALPARQPDRHAAGGLHPHGAGQGPVRAARGLPARRARGDHADRHAARPRHRHPARRRDPHRDRLQHPGHRPLRLRRDHAVRPAGDPGHGAVRCVLHRHHVACSWTSCTRSSTRGCGTRWPTWPLLEVEDLQRPLRDRGRPGARPSTASPTRSTAARRSASSASPARASPCPR